MKLALITDPKGFPLIERVRLSYHLVLAQYVLTEPRYGQFYKDAHDRGDFIMMDNGAAEDGTLPIDDLMTAASHIHADEIILPDVLGDPVATIEKSFDNKVLDCIPPLKRAVVPQGNTMEEWLACANRFVEEMDFATMCVPKHTERFRGGRIKILNVIRAFGWNLRWNIHLLGVWNDPKEEIGMLQESHPWVRGIDTAAPFAWAQHGLTIQATDTSRHISHFWGKSFVKDAAAANIEFLHYLAARTS